MALDPARQLGTQCATDGAARAAPRSPTSAPSPNCIAWSSPHLYAVALRILRESAAAEEVLQESFVNVWHHAGSYVAGKSQPLTWLTSIVRNRCLDQLRRREVDTITHDAR